MSYRLLILLILFPSVFPGQAIGFTLGGGRAKAIVSPESPLKIALDSFLDESLRESGVSPSLDSVRHLSTSFLIVPKKIKNSDRGYIIHVVLDGIMPEKVNMFAVDEGDAQESKIFEEFEIPPLRSLKLRGAGGEDIPLSSKTGVFFCSVEKKDNGTTRFDCIEKRQAGNREYHILERSFEYLSGNGTNPGSDTGLACRQDGKVKEIRYRQRGSWFDLCGYSRYLPFAPAFGGVVDEQATRKTISERRPW